MKVNSNGNTSDFIALQQMLARKALEVQMAAKDKDAGDKTVNKAAPADRNSILQLIAAENLLAAVSDVPDMESAKELAQITREKLLTRSGKMVRGQANIAAADVLKLLE
ncbi:MAG: hypothetical protein ACYS8W_07345 [Planctomycetota bacterium]|jgi:hypothetical protein